MQDMHPLSQMRPHKRAHISPLRGVKWRKTHHRKESWISASNTRKAVFCKRLAAQPGIAHYVQPSESAFTPATDKVKWIKPVVQKEQLNEQDTARPHASASPSAELSISQHLAHRHTAAPDHRLVLRPAPQEHPPQLPLCSPHSPTLCSTYHGRTGGLSPSSPPVPKADLYNIVLHSFCLHFSAFMSCEWHHRWKQAKIRVHAAEHSKGSLVEIRGIFRISALLRYLR